MVRTQERVEAPPAKPTPEYRYTLTRDFDAVPGSLFADPPRAKSVLFVLMNPSTATATEDDPTIRRCIGFAKLWGMLRLEVVNLFAARATDPVGLLQFEDPVGPGNDAAISEAVDRAGLIVVAWGAFPKELWGRDEDVLKMIQDDKGRTPLSLGICKRTKHPRHPLFVQKNQRPVAYSKLRRLWMERERQRNAS